MSSPQDKKKKKSEKRSSPQNKRLFFLIKSMTTKEKRAFNTYNSLNYPAQDLKFNKLYNTINSLSQFDEEKMSRRIERITKNAHSASQMKLDLYQRLLQFLRFHLDTKPQNADMKIRSLLLNVRILYDRGLHEQILHFLKKIKKLIEETERYFFLPEVVDWEKRALFLTGQKNIKSSFDAFKKQEEKSYQKINNLRTIWNVHLDLLAVHREEGFVTRQDHISQLKEILDKLELLNSTITLSTHEQILYHFSYQMYYHTIGDWEHSFEHSQHILQLLEKHPNLTNEYKHYYINATAEVSRYYMSQEKYSLSLETIEKINIPRFNQHFKVYSTYKERKISLNICVGNFEENIPLIEDLEKQLKGKSTFFQLPFYYLATYNYFGIKNYQQVSHYANSIIDSTKYSNRIDLVSTVKIMNLIIDLELNNIKLLEFKLRSMFNFLNKRERIHSFESIIIQLIRTTIDIQGSSALFNSRAANQLFIKALQKIKSNIDILKETEPNNPSLYYFNYLAWIESQITKKPFKEILKEQYKHTLLK